LGSLGDAAILSFGKDKLINAGVGGALVINRPKLAQQLTQAYQALPAYPLRLSGQNLFYLSFMLSIKPVYHLKISRGLIWAAQQAGLLPKAVSKAEKQLKPTGLYRLPDYLYPLIYQQLSRLPQMMQVRQTRVALYNQAFGHRYQGGLLKYPLRVRSVKACLSRLRRAGFFVSRWYSRGVEPAGVSLTKYRIEPALIKQVTSWAHNIINLPTYGLTHNQQKRLIRLRLVASYAD